MRKFFLVTMLLVCSDVIASEIVLPKGIIVIPEISAPALELSDSDGNLFTLSKQRGHWVFVHFWASWCGPCRREIPAIQRMLEKIENEDSDFDNSK